jgi:hypothetical protein
MSPSILFSFLVLFFSFVVFAQEKQESSTRTIMEEETIEGTEYSEGSELTQDEKGKLLKVVLGKDQEILNKISDTPKFPITLSSGSILLFDPNAKFTFLPSKIKVSRNVDFVGIPILAGSVIQVSGGKFEHK